MENPELAAEAWSVVAAADSAASHADWLRVGRLARDLAMRIHDPDALEAGI